MFATKKSKQSTINAITSELKGVEASVDQYYEKYYFYCRKLTELETDFETIPEFTPEWQEKCQEAREAKELKATYYKLASDLHVRAENLRAQLSELR